MRLFTILQLLAFAASVYPADGGTAVSVDRASTTPLFAPGVRQQGRRQGARAKTCGFINRFRGEDPA